MSDKITVKLKMSTNGCTDIQKANVRGLGLRKVGQKSTLPNTPCVRGMIKKVIHMLEIAQ
jgi:large subunit ribosomal protein L30